MSIKIKGAACTFLISDRRKLKKLQRKKFVKKISYDIIIEKIALYNVVSISTFGEQLSEEYPNVLLILRSKKYLKIIKKSKIYQSTIVFNNTNNMKLYKILSVVDAYCVFDTVNDYCKRKLKK